VAVVGVLVEFGLQPVWPAVEVLRDEVAGKW
jgi:hypothetical protein